MPFPSTNFVACFPLQEFFIDKDTGGPLSAGILTFYRDIARTTFKDVYMQVQLPSNEYEFVNIGYVITLSSVGTPQYNGSDFIPFLFPYDGDPNGLIGNVDLYYITVDAAVPPVGNGSRQFTREAWPPTAQIGGGGSSSGAGGVENVLANPQFVQVNFLPDVGAVTHTFNVTGTPESNLIAPDWYIVTNGAGTVTLTRIIPSSDTDIPSQPPYTLEISSTGVTSIQLLQRISNSPRLFAEDLVSAYFIAKSVDNIAHTLSLSYIPSTGSQYVIATGTTTDDNNWVEFTIGANGLPVTPIDQTINPDPANTGYVDISLSIPTLATIQVSSFQLVGANSLQSAISFEQQSTPRQIDHLFHDYLPQLSFKPIPSYLVAWDFALNPCQFYGQTIAPIVLGGPNLSRYIADQTILFSSIDNSIGAAISADGGINFSTGVDSSFAIIQYLDGATVLQLLQEKLCVSIQTFSAISQVPCEINLYWTTDATLPNVAPATYLSLVSNVSPTAVQTTGHGTWNKVPRSNKLGDARFNLVNNVTQTPATYMFNGWDDSQNLGIVNATYFAIVVSFGTLVAANQIVVRYVSLNAGDIATLPAPQTPDEVLRECQYYYETSVTPGSVPTAGSSPGIFATQFANVAGGIISAYATTFTTIFNTPKRAANVAYFQTYSPTSGTAGNVDFQDYAGGIAQGGNNLSNACFTFTMGNTRNVVAIGNTGAAQLVGASSTSALPWVAYINYNFSYDARLGILL